MTKRLTRRAALASGATAAIGAELGAAPAEALPPSFTGAPANTATFYPEDHGPIGAGDDTAAVQACIDAAVGTGGGTVQFGPTTYTFATPPRVDTVNRTNTVLRLPANVATSGSLALRGVRGRTRLKAAWGSTPAYSGFTGVPSLIGGGTPQLMTGFGFRDFAGWHVTVADLDVEMGADPAYAAIDLACVTRAVVEDVVVRSGLAPAVPTHPWAFGVRLPRRLNYGTARVRDVEVAGLYVGFAVSTPHTILENTIPNHCAIAYGLVESGTDPHGTTLVGAQGQQCIRYLTGWDEARGPAALSSAFFLHGNLDLEFQTTGPFACRSHVSDPGDQLRGHLWYLLTEAGVGHSDALSVEGAKRLRTINWAG